MEMIPTGKFKRRWGSLLNKGIDSLDAKLGGALTIEVIGFSTAETVVELAEDDLESIRVVRMRAVSQWPVPPGNADFVVRLPRLSNRLVLFQFTPVSIGDIFTWGVRNARIEDADGNVLYRQKTELMGRLVPVFFTETGPIPVTDLSPHIVQIGDAVIDDSYQEGDIVVPYGCSLRLAPLSADFRAHVLLASAETTIVRDGQDNVTISPSGGPETRVLIWESGSWRIL